MFLELFKIATPEQTKLVKLMFIRLLLIDFRVAKQYFTLTTHEEKLRKTVMKYFLYNTIL